MKPSSREAGEYGEHDRRAAKPGYAWQVTGSLRRALLVGIAGLLVINLAIACGKVGAPIPPEDIGVAAKIERERQEALQAETESEQAPVGTKEDAVGTSGERARDQVDLPPFRPIGTQ